MVKDFKFLYETIRLNTWCEEVQFSIVTPGTYLEFDNMQVKFTTKSRSQQLGCKISDVKVDGSLISIPTEGGPQKLTNNQKLSITCLVRQQATTADKQFESMKDVNMVLYLFTEGQDIYTFKKYWALPEMRPLYAINCELKGPFIVLNLQINPDSKSEKVINFS